MKVSKGVGIGVAISAGRSVPGGGFGSNLISNGNFNVNLDGWTGINANLSRVNNAMQVTATAGFGYAYSLLSDSGVKNYRLAFDIISGANNNGVINIYDENTQVDSVLGAMRFSVGSHIYDFSSSGLSSIRARVVVSGTSVIFDNMSIMEIL